MFTECSFILYQCKWHIIDQQHCEDKQILRTTITAVLQITIFQVRIYHITIVNV